MKLPRDLSSDELVKALARLGYVVDHQTGSHIRLTTQRDGEHHVTILSSQPTKRSHREDDGEINQSLLQAFS